jgi:Domain of unknown function (DUF4062)
MEDLQVIRVFISSKQSEFKAEREALANLVRPLPLLAPVLAEDWSPQRSNVVDRFLEDVRRSPIYVGLFGCLCSDPTIVEYRTACENPFREILVFVRFCPAARMDAALEPVLQEIRGAHTTRQFTDLHDLLPAFTTHLWNAVERMVAAYLKLKEPFPLAQGSQRSVLQRRWESQREHLLKLGLPGDATPESATRWAQRLSAMLEARGFGTS